MQLTGQGERDAIKGSSAGPLKGHKIEFQESRTFFETADLPKPSD